MNAGTNDKHEGLEGGRTSERKQGTTTPQDSMTEPERLYHMGMVVTQMTNPEPMREAFKAALIPFPDFEWILVVTNSSHTAEQQKQNMQAVLGRYDGGGAVIELVTD